MRKFKTSEDNRTNYIYFFDDGSKCVINPNEDGVDTTIIAKLHEMDDATIDAERREEYHCPVHYENYYDGSGEDANDRNPYLEDTGSDPLEMMLASISEQEHTEKLDKLKTAITGLSELQRNVLSEYDKCGYCSRGRCNRSGCQKSSEEDFYKTCKRNLKFLEMRGFDSSSFLVYGQRGRQKPLGKESQQ